MLNLEKKIFFTYSLAVIFTVFLIGCNTNGVPMLGTGVSGSEGLPADQISFAKFKDMPIPEGSKMNVEDTLIFGSENEWFGRLSIVAIREHSEVFDFFRYEMPNFGWKEITTVRAESSVLTYEYNKRIATIQISSSRVGNAICSITVSPKEYKDTK